MRAFEEEAYANELPWLAFLRCPLPVKARRCREIHSQRIIIPTASWIQEEYSLPAAYSCIQHFLDSLRPRMRWRQVRGLYGAQLSKGYASAKSCSLMTPAERGTTST